MNPTQTAPTPSVRVNTANPNHHLWNNNGTWFLHYTVHPDALTKARVRTSLRTHCLETARTLRDQILHGLAACQGGVS